MQGGWFLPTNMSFIIIILPWRHTERKHGDFLYKISWYPLPFPFLYSFSLSPQLFFGASMDSPKLLVHELCNNALYLFFILTVIGPWMSNPPPLHFFTKILPPADLTLLYLSLVRARQAREKCTVLGTQPYCSILFWSIRWRLTFIFGHFVHWTNSSWSIVLGDHTDSLFMFFPPTYHPSSVPTFWIGLPPPPPSIPIGLPLNWSLPSTPHPPSPSASCPAPTRPRLRSPRPHPQRQHILLRTYVHAYI